MGKRLGRRYPVPRALLAALLLACTPGVVHAQDEDRSPRCDDLMPDDLHRICVNGRLTVARFNGERPPFFYSSPQQRWVGFDIDVAKDIAAKLGVEYAEILSAESFDKVIDLVASGQADVGISKLSSTLSRATRVRFTNPYITVYQTILVNRLSAPTQQDPFVALNAEPFRIGALSGSSYVGYAENSFPRAAVAPYQDFATMMDDVTRGAIAAVFVDSARAHTWRQQNPERLIQVRAFVDKERKDPLAFAVRWQDTHLLSWLNQYLNRIRVDGSADALYRKWFLESRDSPGPGPEAERVE